MTTERDLLAGTADVGQVATVLAVSVALTGLLAPLALRVYRRKV